ncbi:WRKY TRANSCRIPTION FACTOR 58-RELATED [Salix koriyanagi]|uniref:WRKY TRANSCRIPTION FACTOR 58-RELATED n=1 Tax=Salix koriyanagi TaxID=2511006 RepID=A0A9Q1AEB8_9ROSI|nr:WRKY TRANSCRIPTION FACTOR 58-RELATED [Salix koriyanagi]
MAKNEKEQQQPKQQEPSSPSKPVSSRPINITLPPRSFTETFLSSGPPGTSGFSPGPMTLLSGFFPGSDDCKSFSQLLSGTMASPNFKPADDKSPAGDFSRPGKLSMVPPSPMFTMPLGLSPVALPDSSGFGLFSPEGFGMIHQQAIAQAAQADSKYACSTGTGNCRNRRTFPRSYKRSESSSLAADKPTDDGYNWRKYGQKQVKGSEFPRSYYKCTLPICPVKKKVERSLDGQVTEIIYKGQHNHEPPRPDKRGKDTGRINGSSNSQEDCEIATQFQSGNVRKMGDRKDQESSQATPEHVSGMSDYEEVSDTETGGQIDEDEPGPKRRTTEVRVKEPASSHKTVTESRIVVQTTSEVDLLDDGYRWRKYGQKVVKGNHYPRRRLLVLDRATISVAVKIGTPYFIPI